MNSRIVIHVQHNVVSCHLQVTIPSGLPEFVGVRKDGGGRLTVRGIPERRSGERGKR